MHPILQLFGLALGAVACYAILQIGYFIYQDMSSSLRHLKGPPNESLLFGNLSQLQENEMQQPDWVATYGSVFTYRSLFSTQELFVSDLKAISHIFGHPTIFQRQPRSLALFTRFVGKGLLSTELDPHKRQRRVLNQAFGPAQVRVVTDTFADLAEKLRDIWIEQLTAKGGSDTLDVFAWMRRMTLDVIGEAGFHYQFDALSRTKNADTNELERLFVDLLDSPKAARAQRAFIAQSQLPILRFLPLPGARDIDATRAKMDQIGYGILARSKAAMWRDADEGREKLGLGGKRDVLSIILKANLSPIVPESQRLTDEETMAQIPTLFFAGHETTSTALSFALHALSLNQAAQSKLRDEALAYSSEQPTMDELNALPYLEFVTREVMRLHSPVLNVLRTAAEDAVLPLGKVYQDKYGREIDSVLITKGQNILIPIRVVNTDHATWGEDADQFRPERWENLPSAVSAIPGVWANLLTFAAGPQNCVGFRFSLVEFKATLFTLIRAFEFERAVDIGGTANAIQKPRVMGHPELGACLPLVVKLRKDLE